MGRRAVDVFIRDKLVASYPVVLALNGPVTDADYLEEIKEQLRTRSPSLDGLDCAKFIIRHK